MPSTHARGIFPANPVCFSVRGGKDVRNITHVLNFDYPNNSEDYIHRIGRTGRAGATGTAITFFTTDSKFFSLFWFLVIPLADTFFFFFSFFLFFPRLQAS